MSNETGDVVTFFVPGTPIPQGSKTIVKRGGRVWLRDVNGSKLKKWRHKIAATADRGVSFDCPVSVGLRFVMPRPRRPRFFAPAVRPDVDKLTRAVLDALTDSGLIHDDARVVEVEAVKRYETSGEGAGVRVRVAPLPAPDDAETLTRRKPRHA